MSQVAEDGTLVYVNDAKSDERYVDTVGLACSFLALLWYTYGKAGICIPSSNAVASVFRAWLGKGHFPAKPCL